MTIADDRPSPPKHGPYATVTWDAAGGRWVRRLTDDGRGLVSRYVAAYPDTALVLWRTNPALAALVFDRHPPEAVHTAAQAGVAAAAATYDPTPAPGRRAATFKTYAVHAVRTAVLNRFCRPERAGSDARPGRRLTDRMAAVAGDGDPADGLAEADAADRLLACLDRRAAEVVRLRAVLDMSYPEIGAAVRVSPQRARQIFESAMAKLRKCQGHIRRPAGRHPGRMPA